MISPLFLDLLLTLVTSFSLLGLLGVAASLLPWQDRELAEVEQVIVEVAQGPFVPMSPPARRTA